MREESDLIILKNSAHAVASRTEHERNISSGIHSSAAVGIACGVRLISHVERKLVRASGRCGIKLRFEFPIMGESGILLGQSLKRQANQKDCCHQAYVSQQVSHCYFIGRSFLPPSSLSNVSARLLLFVDVPTCERPATLIGKIRKNHAIACMEGA